MCQKFLLKICEIHEIKDCENLVLYSITQIQQSEFRKAADYV